MKRSCRGCICYNVCKYCEQYIDQSSGIFTYNDKGEDEYWKYKERYWKLLAEYCKYYKKNEFEWSS